MTNTRVSGVTVAMGASFNLASIDETIAAVQRVANLIAENPQCDAIELVDEMRAELRCVSEAIEGLRRVARNTRYERIVDERARKIDALAHRLEELA